MCSGRRLAAGRRFSGSCQQTELSAEHAVTCQALGSGGGMDIFEFVECSNRTKSLPKLFNLLVTAAANEGFDQVAYGALTYEEPVHLDGHAAPAVALNFPSDWTDHYFARKYHLV